jgi:hypothetical protein
MANDAFAISPISASSTLPSDADYQAISEAFMETSRGRWFLKEYARRNRNADTAIVLEAVARIEATIVAQKQQAPANALANALEAIRAIIDEARAAASEALDRLSDDQTFAPSRKGVRIIREVAWRMREIGYDGRICDILETQADAIDTDHDALPTQEMHAAVLASFDMIARRIDELADDAGAAGASPDALRAAAKAPAPAPADLAEARLARERAMTQDKAQDMAQEAAPAQPALLEPPAAVLPPSQTLPENVVSLATAKPAAHVAVAGPTAAPAIAEASVPAPAELFDDLADDPALQSNNASAVAEAPGSAAHTDGVAQSPAQPAPTEALSLGQSLLARGVVTASGTVKADPLAPLRRMSQAEKIAFFS